MENKKNTSIEMFFCVVIANEEQLTVCQVGFRKHEPRPTPIKIPDVQKRFKVLIRTINYICIISINLILVY